jgi:hypothetical protein
MAASDAETAWGVKGGEGTLFASPFGGHWSPRL